MENSHILKEVLNALSDHSRQINERFDEMEDRFEKRFEAIDERFEQVDRRFEQVDKRFDNLEKKVDGIRVDLSETQETSNFLLSKVAYQDKKIRNLD